MNVENLQDAISLLPEEMLLDVDRLRQKKRTPWKPVIALAACLCLVAGLWVLQNGGAKAESGSSPMERYPANSAVGDIEHSAETPHFAPMIATVLEVQEDRIIVREAIASDAEPITVMLTELEEIPTLSSMDRIYIYYSEKTDPLIPYKIEHVVFD